MMCTDLVFSGVSCFNMRFYCKEYFLNQNDIAAFLLSQCMDSNKKKHSLISDSCNP